MTLTIVLFVILMVVATLGIDQDTKAGKGE